MRDNIIAMIPARMGSTRLKTKNLAILSGRPLITYAIEAAKYSGVFDRIVLNSEDLIFAEIAKEYGIDFYQRPSGLATSFAKSDMVVQDFLLKNPCDLVAWVNPTSPLQTGNEVKNVVEYFVRNELDSLITVRNEQVHALLDGEPLNFNPAKVFAQTQDLNQVGLFVYSVMMWRTQTFLTSFEKNGHAILNGKKGYFPVSKLTSIIIKSAEDLLMAEYLLAGMKANKNFSLSYYEGRS